MNLNKFQIVPYKRALITIFTCGAIALCLTQALFTYIQESVSNHEQISLEAYLTEIAQERNALGLTQTISNLEDLGILGCARVDRIEPGSFNLINLTNRSDCGLKSPLFLNGIFRTFKVTIGSSEVWSVTYRINNHPTFIVALWITRSALVFAVIFAYIALRKIIQSRVRVEEERAQRFEQLYRFASQVAHDIRSPLAALDMLTADLTDMPEERRLVVRSAVSRIRDIANNILKIKSHQTAALSLKSQSTTVEWLAAITEGLVTEKRIQYRSKLGIDISFDANVNSYGLFSKISQQQFKSVLSNLINNAVEAIDHKGCIKLSIQRNLDGKNEIQIEDNGKGIPKAVLARIGEPGFSYGKSGHYASGNGLGVHHAKQMIESWGGRLAFDSLEGIGTKVVIQLPAADAPDWFLSKLTVRERGNIVILDDDDSVHHVWNERFEKLSHGNEKPAFRHFTTPDQVIEYITSRSTTPDTIYLFDYELLGSTITGLDIVERFGIQKQSVLVTSRFDEPNIQKRCERLRVRLIPKGMVGFVPITILPHSKQANTQSTPSDAYLIDDDELVHMSWGLAAKAKGIAYRGFSNFEDFKAAKVHSLDSPIYVDVSLSNGIRGEEVSLQVKEMGFKNVFLATGYNREDFSHLNHLSGVVGKDPPW